MIRALTRRRVAVVRQALRADRARFGARRPRGDIDAAAIANAGRGPRGRCWPRLDTASSSPRAAGAARARHAPTPHALTPEFMTVRALACEAFYSDFVPPGAPGPGAWEEIDSARRSPHG